MNRPDSSPLTITRFYYTWELPEMARRYSEDQQDFQNYQLTVEITLRRETGSYNTDKMAEVKQQETIPLKGDRAVIDALAHIVEEAKTKAIRSAGLRQDFELNLRALEAGNVVEVND